MRDRKTGTATTRSGGRFPPIISMLVLNGRGAGDRGCLGARRLSAGRDGSMMV